jgi:hypothetical protein
MAASEPVRPAEFDIVILCRIDCMLSARLTAAIPPLEPAVQKVCTTYERQMRQSCGAFRAFGDSDYF